MGFEIGDQVWKPEKGEWCWFYNDHPGFPGCRQPMLFQFNYMFEDKYVNLSTCGDNSYRYDNCEPFKGELPTFLKDK